MSQELFYTNNRLTSIPLTDGNLYFLERIPLELSFESVFTDLVAHTPWRAESISLWGKRYLQPRLTAWYGDAGASYRYSGMTLQPLPWTPLLAQIRETVEQACACRFNSVLLNYYRDQNDSMGFHSDAEPELGQNPAIASLSLGATRTFILKHKFKKEIKPVRIRLNAGNVLLMAGAMQQNWMHGINKETAQCGPRLSLTFRAIVQT